MLELVVFFLPVLILFISIVVFCFDETSSYGFGFLYVLFSQHVPKVLTSIISFFPGGALCISCCSQTGNYIFYKPNPIMQCFFLVLVFGGFTIFVVLGEPLLPNKRLGQVHQVLPYLLLVNVVLSFIAASVFPPGYVTEKNYEKLEEIYPYDGFIFVKRVCETCKTPRVARSKHCRMKNRCVEKYDHYCPWINNTVGALNFRYFLLFVLITDIFLCYGTWVFSQLLLFIIDRDRLYEVEYLNTVTRKTVKADNFIVFQFLLNSYGMLVFVCLLCVVMAVTLLIFFLYQLWMIKDGMTSNEATKWSIVNDFYSSQRWKTERDKRGKDYPSDDQLLGENTASLDDRKVKDFPTKKPINLYDQGSFLRNLSHVVWPRQLNTKRKLE